MFQVSFYGRRVPTQMFFFLCSIDVCLSKAGCLLRDPMPESSTNTHRSPPFGLMQVRETFLASISTCDWKWQGTLNLSWQRLRFKLIRCCVGVIWVEVLNHKAAWLVQSIHSVCFGSVGLDANGTMPMVLVLLNYIELSGVCF